MGMRNLENLSESFLEKICNFMTARAKTAPVDSAFYAKMFVEKIRYFYSLNSLKRAKELERRPKVAQKFPHFSTMEEELKVSDHFVSFEQELEPRLKSELDEKDDDSQETVVNSLQFYCIGTLKFAEKNVTKFKKTSVLKAKNVLVESLKSKRFL